MNVSTLTPSTVKCNHLICAGRKSTAVASVQYTISNGKVLDLNTCPSCFAALMEMINDRSLTYTVAYL